MERKNLNGLILGGGRSSRMGFDKGTIVYHTKPQREYLSGILSKFCDEIYLSCKTAKGIPEDLHPLPDAFAIESPLNGILTAFTNNDTTAWLTIPVDMPGVTEEVIRFLLSNRDPNAVATCFFDSEGKHPEPLLCVWEARGFPALKAFAATGKISPREFLTNSQTKLIKSPFPDLHVNINSQAELDEYRKSRYHS